MKKIFAAQLALQVSCLFLDLRDPSAMLKRAQAVTQSPARLMTMADL